MAAADGGVDPHAEWRVRWALFLVAALLLILQALAFGVCLQDDAFISLRYARNLTQGEGLVFNPGDRVEGYTNFLWTVLGAVPFLTGWDPVVFLRLAGLVSGIGAAAAAASLSARLAPGSRLAGGAAALLVAAAPFFCAEAVMGLETAAFAALVTWGVALHLRETGDDGLPGGARPWSGVVLGLAALTRPEGWLVAGVVGLIDLGAALHERRIGTSRVLRWVVFGVLAGSQFVLRVLYYGELFPNTYYAKVGLSWPVVLRGGKYALEFAWAAAPLLALGTWGLVCRVRQEKWRPARAIGPALVLPFLYGGYVILVGGDYKPTFRFFAVPALLAAAWAGAGLSSIGPAGRRFTIPARLGLLLLVGLLLVGLGGPVRRFARRRADELPTHLAAGRWLLSRFPPDTLLATSNAGAIPYASNLPTLDMLGLVDRHIAHRSEVPIGSGMAGHERGDGAYVLERRPRLILFQLMRFTDAPLAQGAAVRPLWLGEKEVWADPRFHRDYALRSAQLPGFCFNYFERAVE